MSGWRRRLRVCSPAAGDQDGDPDAGSGEDAWRENYGTLLIYVAAMIAYAVAGMYWHFLLSWTRGFVFAFLAVWAVPALYRRFRP